jgi:AraC-like DNA-binding protein
MDALSDVLRVVRLDGGVFLRAEFTAPWCIRSQVAASDCAPLLTDVDRLILYHYVVEGRCALAVSGQPPMEIGAGDAVIFPRNDPHVMGSDLSLEAIDSHNILKPSSSGSLAYINHGGGGSATHMVCGFLGYRRVEGNPLIDALPPVLHLDTRESSAAAWIQSSFQFAADEIALGRAGTDSVLAKISELLFVEAIRRYIDALPAAEKGWLAGCKDPFVARALAQLHTAVGEIWTLDRLARQLGLSRSALCNRFTALVGEPPMHYLTRWRLHVAAQRLRRTRSPLVCIAQEVGFETEEAFNRAFKRRYGKPPATWRNHLTGQSTAMTLNIGLLAAGLADILP